MTKHYDELQIAIEKHLEENGPKGWQAVMDRFPDVSRATFWRYVRSAQRGEGAPRDPDAPPPTREELLQKVAQESVLPEAHYADQTLEMMTGYPRYRLVVKELQQLIDDAAQLKAQSLDRNGKIRNFQMYARSIRLREKLVYSQLNALEEIARLGVYETFTKRVLQVIAEESPQVFDRFMSKLGKIPKPEVKFRGR